MDKWPNILWSIWPFTKVFNHFILFIVRAKYLIMNLVLFENDPCYSELCTVMVYVDKVCKSVLL